MTGALAIGALRTLAAENLAPAALLNKLNRQIAATQDSGFITCLCTRIGLNGAVTLANAGHLSPYRNGAEVAVDPGLPLGLVADVEYSETTCQLTHGDTLTMLSDGVVEASNADGQLYGFERTREISTQTAHMIASTAQAFGQEDDITVLTVERTLAQ
jgi:serine phosphatase RsbU (regulator of sigma subunit)